MKSVSKTGKIFEGKLAALMVKVGVAKPLENGNHPAQKTNKSLTAVQIAKQIAECETIEDLQLFESDKRQVVEIARKKKFKELG